MSKYVYELKNTVNGKRYIGSSRFPDTRFNQHICLLKRGVHSNKELQHDYKRYGNVFEMAVLCESGEDKSKEYEYMRIFKTYDERYGYNCSDPAMNPFRRSQGLSYRNSPLKGRKIPRNSRERKMFNKIRFLARKKGLSVTELEKRLGLANGIISKRDERSPSATNLYLVAKYLNVTMEYLMDGVVYKKAGE